MRFLFAVLLYVCSLSVAIAAPKVVSSIAPVHSLVASVMQGVGDSELLLPADTTPHGFSLKPSHVAMLATADLVIWVGPNMEEFLLKLLERRIKPTLTLGQVDGVRNYSIRERDDFGDYGKDEGDEHDEDAEHDDADAEHEEEDEHEHEHEQTGIDPHIWLSPTNAQAMLASIAMHLSDIDQANAAIYQKNAARTSEVLQELTTNIQARFIPLRKSRFVVFHDAYQYFERSFGLQASGVITLNPLSPPSAKQIARIHAAVQKEGISCIFGEPQFSQRLLDRLVKGTNTNLGQLDPLGATLTPGTMLYTQLLENMASSFME